MTKRTTRRTRAPAGSHDWVEIFRGRDGWRIRLKSPNHKVIGVGESYTRKYDAIRAAKRTYKVAIIRVVAVALLALGLTLAPLSASAQTLPPAIQAAMDALKAEILKALTPSPPTPPADVDCVVSPLPPAWNVVSSTIVGVCDINGKQNVLEVLSRTITTPQAGKGAACQPTSSQRIVQQDCAPPPPPPPPVTGRLIQASDFANAYQGAMRTPSVAGAGNPGSFNFGGTAMAFNPANKTIFMVGHDHHQLVAEITPALPGKASTLAGLPVATFRQPFASVLAGKIGQVGNGAKIGGILPVGNSLVVSVFLYYDANNDATTSHFVTGSNFSAMPPVVGPVTVANDLGKAGYVAGYMVPVPPEWHAGLGCAYLTGQNTLSIISRTSTVAALTCFDPSALTSGTGGPTLMGKALVHDQIGYGRSAQTGGVIFPPGTRSILVFGRKPTLPECYGTGTNDQLLHGKPVPNTQYDKYCYDPHIGSKGYHGYPYQLWVWAYDVNDLIAVKNGTKPFHQVNPYAEWPLPAIQFPDERTVIQGVTYDPVTKRIFASAFAGTGSPILVHVFRFP